MRVRDSLHIDRPRVHLGNPKADLVGRAPRALVLDAQRRDVDVESLRLGSWQVHR